MLCTPCKLAVEWGLAAVAVMGGPAEVPPSMSWRRVGEDLLSPSITQDFSVGSGKSSWDTGVVAASLLVYFWRQSLLQCPRPGCCPAVG